MIKYFRITSMVSLLIICLVGCEKKEDIKVSSAKPEVEMVDQVTGSSATGSIVTRLKVVQLSNDTVYLLKSNFVREAGEQLIIEAGTLIKVSTNSSTSLPSITINKGATITATGTREEPIVFTSDRKAGTQGVNWSGLILRGNSFNNMNGTAGDPADFSGVLQFVRVEFAPVVFDAVGNKTLVENVMVSYTDRDPFDQYQSAFTFIGGTFNARYLISYACNGPSDFMITNGYAGNLQNVIACRHPFFGKIGANPTRSVSGIFIQNSYDNPAVPRNPYTNPVISNLTVVGPDAQNGSPNVYADTTLRSAALVTTNSACFQIRNSVLLGYPAGGWFLNDRLIAENLQSSLLEFNYSTVHSNIVDRVFYLQPGTAGSYNSAAFRYYMETSFTNKVYTASDDFMLEDIINFDDGPNLVPKENSPLLTGASFAPPAQGFHYFGNSFFDNKISYVGALGREDWTRGWTNFIPLKTNYNFP